MSVSAKIHACEAFQDVENEWGTHVFYHAIEDRPGFTSTYRWSHRPDCCATHGFGCLVGYDRCEVEWRTGIYEGTDEDLPLMLAEYPELKDRGEYWGLMVHNLCSSVIEVAEDGKSARSAWMTPGMIGRPSSLGGQIFMMVMWERYGQDWVFEDGDDAVGEWRLLHNMVAEDFTLRWDACNHAAVEYENFMKTGLITNHMMSQESPRNIQILGPTHYNLSIAQVRQPEPACPEAYTSLEDVKNYIPSQGIGYRHIRVFDPEK